MKLSNWFNAPLQCFWSPLVLVVLVPFGDDLLEMNTYRVYNPIWPILETGLSGLSSINSVTHAFSTSRQCYKGLLPYIKYRPVACSNRKAYK